MKRQASRRASSSSAATVASTAASSTEPVGRGRQVLHDLGLGAARAGRRGGRRRRGPRRPARAAVAGIALDERDARLEEALAVALVPGHRAGVVRRHLHLGEPGAGGGGVVRLDRRQGQVEQRVVPRLGEAAGRVDGAPVALRAPRRSGRWPPRIQPQKLSTTGRKRSPTGPSSSRIRSSDASASSASVTRPSDPSA